jgi:hypothetical protein
MRIAVICKDIRVNRQQFENNVNEFRAYWGKVYKPEMLAELKRIVDELHEDPKNQALKNQRYALEQVCAKVKSMTLSDEVKEVIVNLHDNYGLTFECLTADFIRENLTGTDYVNEDGVRELRKANKDATEKTWEIIEKWTPAKVGRYFRLAIIAKQELNK